MSSVTRGGQLQPPSTAKPVKYIVHFLDNSNATFEVDKKDKAQVLLDKVYQHLELNERDFFGLQFTDIVQCDEEPSSTCSVSERMLRWIDPMKSLKKQMKFSPPFLLYFRVKFYVPDAICLKEEYTRYHFFLQLTKDLADGRLVGPFKTCILLASYAVQSELGDYNPDEHSSHRYLSEFRFVPSQTDEMLREVEDLHKKHRGMSPASCELLFIETAKSLDGYGIDLFKAMLDTVNEEIQLGVTSLGLVVFQNNVKVNTFCWSKIVKISFKRKQFFIHLRKEPDENIENIFGFNMTSYRLCKNLWKSCVEHHTFFCLHTLQQQQPTIHEIPIVSQFKNSGISLDRSQTLQPNTVFTRSHSNSEKSTTKQKNLDVSSSSSWSEEKERKKKIDFVVSSKSPFSRDPRTIENARSSSKPTSSSSSRGSSSLRSNGLSNVVDCCETTSFKTNFDDATIDALLNNGRCSSHHRISPPPPPPPLPPSIHISNAMTTSVDRVLIHNSMRCQNVDSSSDYLRNYRSLDRRSSCVDRKNEIKKLSESFDSKMNSFSSPLDDEKYLQTLSHEGNISLVGCQLRSNFFDINNAACQQNDEQQNLRSINGRCCSVQQENHGLVVIRMKPDEEGRFGFNVKGGSDQMSPIIVSRVAPGTSADSCLPRLMEGDQVLFINGRDISQHTHAQVVQFIKASREIHSGELVLVVRPNVYIGEDNQPDLQYIPDTHHIIALLSPGGNPLSGSMTLLRESIESNAAVAQFEQIYRKNAGLTLNVSQLPENISKNRYRDISPYDQTRVKLKGSTEDYINANYVNMEVPGSGIINRYIAAQGPLPDTTAHFWMMIWEQRSSLVVMLTMTVEQGRVKCHSYWPDLNETLHLGKLSVTCICDETTTSFAFRDFILTHSEMAAERHHVYQMQYLAWPDHGVPDDCSDFLHFVFKVRQKRAGVVEPTIIHCSAGIGRTGVLIAMETSMCLIESNQPVYLLDIVRQMRDQRAMLIQTPDQYKFVCEAVLKVYDDHMVEPIDDFNR